MKEVTAARVADPERLRNYLRDESSTFYGHADELFLPANQAELADVVRAANEWHMLLTVSGGGTSITGSRVPTNGGAVVSVERMTSAGREPPTGFEEVQGAGFDILLNTADKTAIVPPAITLSALDEILARFGLLYPPDPTEMSATMGGTVATNASGARSFHYGPTRAWIRRLRVVLPTGEMAELHRGEPAAKEGTVHFTVAGRTVEVPLPPSGEYDMPRTKNAAGLYLAPGMEPIDLFIGCEGLLGVVSEVQVDLVERPDQTLTVVAYFGSCDDAFDFVDAAVSDSLKLAEVPHFLSLEYFDHRSLDFMREAHPHIPKNVAAAVLFEVPYSEFERHNPYPDTCMLSEVEEALAKHRVVSNWAVPGARREEVRLFRHSLPEAVNDFVRRRGGKIGSDMAVPHERFRQMMGAYEGESAACGVGFLMFGHIGDDHIHLNYLPENDEEAERAKRAYSRLARTAVGLGGTISAEHGVGKKCILDENGRLIPYLQVLYGVRGLRAIARVKKALDPNGILNIGNMVPPEMLA